MTIIAMLAVMATQPNPLLPPPWVQGDLSTKGMYAKYGRLEPDGTYSTLSATKNVCDCKVSELQADWIKGLTAPGVTIKRDTQAICGVDAAHIVAIGVATSSDKTTQNNDAFIFRQGPAAYIMQYRFRYPQPHPDDEKALSALCPTPSGS